MSRPTQVAELLADDPHDRRLVDHVRPGGWRNPRPRDRYDLVVVGGGTAGLVTTAIAAAVGARVALVERRLLGGDCLNFGCVPSKTLLRAARAWSAARSAEPRFAGPRAAAAGDFAAAMERVRRVRAEISGHDSAARFAGLGADVFLGDGRFTAPDRLEVDGARLRFRRAVIATGARPAVPAIEGLREAGYLTNETVFSLTEPPRRLAVLGGGAVGCELAQAFARLGVRVTLLEARDRVLASEDPEASGIVRRALERDGVVVRTGAQVRSVERSGEQRQIAFSGGGERKIAADAILVATGRVPNVEGMGLEAAGVEHHARGVVTDDRLRTTSTRIYAVGDVTGRSAFTHAADAHARLVVPNALFFGRGKVSDLVVPRVTYTSPEVAHVGLAPSDAAARGDQVDEVTVALDEVDRARIDGETEGFLKVWLQPGSDRILGATLVSPGAGDLISQITTAIAADLGLGKLGEVIHPYPTTSEIIRKAADKHRRTRLTPRARSVLEGTLKLLR